MLRNHTVKLENGTVVNAWLMHMACMLGNPGGPQWPTDGVHPLCDRTSDSQPLYEDDWVSRRCWSTRVRSSVAHHLWSTQF